MKVVQSTRRKNLFATFGSFISLLAFCLFWIGRHFTYLIIKVYRKYYIDILRMAQSNLTCHLFLWYIAIPSYRDWTNPNTILRVILMVIFISVESIIPANYFTSRFRVSRQIAICEYECVSAVGPVWQNLRTASSIHRSNLTSTSV